VNACILTIGDELLQGNTVNTNSSWIGRTLIKYDIIVKKIITIGDDIESIIIEMRYILNSGYDYIFVTGGLGPTHDDITKNAFVKLFNDKLIFNQSYYNKLKSKYEKNLIKMPSINRSQAMYPEKANIIPNNFGSALGMQYKDKNSNIFVMPGVPEEMKNMINDYILPELINKPLSDNVITIKTSGIMESKLAEKVNKIIIKYSNSCKFAFLPSYYGVSFRINRIDHNINIQDVKDEFYKAMEPYSFGINDDTLENYIANKLITQKHTIALAESCTGGNIAKRLSSIPGSSKYFLGGIVAYSNILKTKLLHVNLETLNKFGAVSKQVALEMARGIRENTKADIGISTTGISGPDSLGKKPIGLVYIALVSSNKTIVKKYNFNFGRNAHRELTTTATLNIIRLSDLF